MNVFALRPASPVAGVFWALWALLLGVRLWLAALLPLFGDEAFYAWEARHPAWAYSDLPGFTAWSILAGRSLFEGELGIRICGLVLGALLPLQLLRIADAAGVSALRWQVGLLGLLLPLLSINGLLALPEPALLLAAALCLHALLSLQNLGPWASWQASALPLLELLAGLVLGAFTHYRFLAVLAAGGLAMVWVPAARALLRDARVWGVGLLGLCAWLPLLLFDAGGELAGWRFQFVDRHPWAFQPVALAVPLEQALVATPFAWLLMLLALPQALRDRSQAPGPALLAAAGGGLLLGLFLVGLFADRERVSFHWPLVGQLALLPLLAQRLACASVTIRRWGWGMLAFGAALSWGMCLLLALPSGRDWLAQYVDLADNFTDASSLQAAIDSRLEALPVETRLLADNFLLAARLVEMREGDERLGVMDHPRNAKHGRARQLQIWAMDEAGWRNEDDAARLLVVEETALGLRARQPWQRMLCERLPGLRWVDEVQLHGGTLRYLLFEQRRDHVEPCRFAPLAYLDVPLEGARLQPRFSLSGWAIQEGEGLSRVEVLLAGRMVATARSDIDFPGVRAMWPGSSDPRHPYVGIRAEVEAPAGLRGCLPLQLRLYGQDGRARTVPMAEVCIED